MSQQRNMMSQKPRDKCSGEVLKLGGSRRGISGEAERDREGQTAMGPIRWAEKHSPGEQSAH